MVNKFLDWLFGHNWLIFNELQPDGKYITVAICKRCLKTKEMISIDDEN